MARVALIALLLVLASAFAFAKSYSVPECTVDITINPDSTFDVVETWRYSFEGSFSAVDRVIYISKIDGISGIGAYENGMPMDFDVDRDSGQVMITLNFRATDEEREFTIRYRVHGGMNYYSDVDSLFWKAMPAERTVPIGHVKVVVHFPAPVSQNETETALHTRGTNSRTQFLDDRTLVFEADNSPPGDDFEVGTTLPKGMVAEVFSQKRWLEETVAPLFCPGFPMLMLLAMLTLHWQFGRDPPSRFSAFRVTSPPGELEPGLVGTLLDEQADDRDIMATLYDLARRGYVTIVEQEAVGGLISRGKNYVLNMKGDKLDPSLKKFEVKVLEVFFPTGGPGSQTTIGILRADQNASFRMNAAKNEFYAEARQRGFFPRNPNTVRGIYALAGLLIAFGGAIGAAAIDMPIPIILGIFGGGLIVLLFSNYMSRKTQLGADEKAKWEAFKRYLEELTRFKSTPEGKGLFEKFYPYAVVFGIEKGIVAAFDRVGAPVPIWFVPIGVNVGSRGTDAIAGGKFGGGLGSLNSLQGATNGFYRALNAVARSGGRSGGGSFRGGGGFSGGGGGGGGGMGAR